MKIGDKVRLTPEIVEYLTLGKKSRSPIAKILYFSDDKPQYAVLDKTIHGFCCWNVKDLVVHRAK